MAHGGMTGLPVMKAVAYVPASQVSGGRDQWSGPLSPPPEDKRAAVWDLLHEVLDPEIPISLMDLGLIYDVDLMGTDVTVRLTFTATACPCMAFIREDIEDRLLMESWIERVEIEEVWDPPWTNDRISERGREALKRLGVGVSG